jgi:NAD+ dependent glucose-6-phosphate dehydrogenase
MKVGITGAEGHIGTVLRSGLGQEFTIRAFTLSEQNFASTVADLSDISAVEGIFEGLDAIAHFAADPEPSGSWNSMLNNNIVGTYNVLEECRRAGVKKVVFATTNYTQHGDTMGDAPDVLDEAKRRRLKLSDPLNPTSLYGVSKATGEQLGRYFSTHHGIQFVGLRIGSTGRSNRPTGDHPSPSDSYNMAMFISNNDSRIFDLTETNEKLGFYPVDNSANY